MSKGDIEAAIRAVQSGTSVRTAVREYNVPRTTLRDRMAAIRRDVPEPLSDAGYELAGAEMTPEEAWKEHTATFERELSKAAKNQWRIIKRKGPFCIFHSTDEHVDDNKTPLSLIEADIKAARDMNAVMVHGGDCLNNWPMAGRLAKQWSEQDCTAPKALLRMQHFVKMFDPDVWIDGNHEEMNPYLEHLIDTYLPKKVIRDYWTANFIVKTPNRDFRCIVSHKFQKGSSWFHPNHGVLREGMEGEEADIYMEGHKHIAGVMHRYMPERGHRFVAVASAGYKVMDRYAARISRGGKAPKVDGRAHWLICDDQAPDSSLAVHAFDDPKHAEVYLNGLQNIREL